MRWAALLAAITLLACGGKAPEATPSPGAEATFRFVQGPEPRTLDPALITDAYSGFIAANLFEGLLIWNASADAVVPGMAERWEVSPDGRTWTFHLRHDAIWSNGDPVTATDFVLAWRRVLDPDTGSDYAGLLMPIRGAEDLAAGRTADARTLGVEAHDRFTLVVTLERPTPWFGKIVAHHVAAPVNARALKRHGRGWWGPGTIVVNGPFDLGAWVPGEKIVLERNPYYHAADEVALDRVEALLEEDPEEVLRLYEAGAVHWTGHASGLLPGDRLEALAKRPDAHLQAQLGTVWYHLNTREEPLSDLRVRQALNLALDRGRMAVVLGTEGVPTVRLVPGGVPGYRSPDPAPPDPAAARALLAEAGFPGGEGLPKLELAIDRRSTHRRVAAEVSRQWRDVLGLEVEVYERGWTPHSEALEAGEFQVGRAGWIADFPDPANFLELLVSDHPLNHSGWADPNYDTLVREAERTEDPASRMRLLAQAERILLEQAPVLPLFHLGSLTLIKPEVRGYVDNALDVHPLRWVRLEG